MFTYRLLLEDGSDAGTATYAMMIKPGEEIPVGNGRRFASSTLSRSRRKKSRRSWGCYRLRRSRRAPR